MKLECKFCFEKVSNCICIWHNCSVCKKRIPESEAYEYRGAISCEEHSEEATERRDLERQEVMKETNHAVRSQADGEWQNGGYKYMKTDPHTGKPITKIKESQRLKEYEGRS